MSSVGQGVGMVVGGIIGFFAGGNVALGMAIGGAIGAAIDPPKGPHIEGPRLNDKSVQSSSYGEVVPKVFGTVALLGNIFWVENNELKETAKTEESGGKGGGGQETTSYTYSATFATALCMGPVEAIKRIWIGSKLVYDVSAITDIDALIERAMANTQFSGGVSSVSEKIVTVIDVLSEAGALPPKMAIYYGTDDQLPDPRMEAALGVGNVPAYRGICYIVFYDLELANYGNSLLGAQVKVEVVSSAVVPDELQFAGVDTVSMTGNSFYSCPSDDPRELIIGAKGDASQLYQQGSFSGQSQGIALLDTISNLAPAAQNFGLPISGAVHSSPRYVFVGNTVYDGVEVTNPPSWDHLNAIHTAALLDSGLWFAGSNGTSKCAFRCNGGNYTGEAVATDSTEVFGLSGGVFSIFYSAGSYSMRIRTFDEYTFAMVDEVTFTTPGQAHAPWASPHGGVLASMLGRTVYIMIGTSPVGYAIGAYDLDAETFALIPLDFSAAPGGSPSSWWASGPSIFRAFDGGIFVAAGYYGTGPAETNIVTWVLPGVTPNTVLLSEVVSALCLESPLTASDINVTSLATDEVRGYTVASAGTLRNAIEPLQAVWPFDAVPSGYKIKFVRRPTSSVLTIPESDLAAVSGSDGNKARLTESREMDSQLPVRISVRYPDVAREYDVSEQYDERLNTQAINQRIVDLPIVLNATEAANTAQQLLYRGWVERNRYGFVIPPKPDYLSLEAADVVTVQTSYADHEILLTEITLLPDGRLECVGLRNSSAVHSPNAVGVEGTALAQTLSVPSPTVGQILDIPQMHADQGSACVVAAMYPRDSSNWSGGALVLSRDGVPVTVATKLPPTATVGVTSGALAAPLTTAMVDTSATVSAYFFAGTPSSVTQAQLLNGNNLFAIGAHGRWEIVGVRDVTLTSTKTYTLSNMLRGMYGTEWAVSTHQIGDSVIHLNPNALALGYLKTSDFDNTYEWWFTSLGMQPYNLSKVSIAVSGVNLECFSPVFIAGTRHPTTLAWSFDWRRRTRYNGEWLDYADVPLNETSELYDLEIYSDSNYSTLKRTFSGVTPSTVSYTSDQQTTDFGAPQITLYVKLYQISELRGRGTPLVSVINYKDTDPYWASVTSAIHFNGADNATALTDEKGIVWTHTTAGINCKLSTTQKKFGTASGYFPDVNTSYWSTPDSADFQPGAADFTIDAHIYLTTYSSGRPIVMKRNGATKDWELTVNPAGTINFNCFNSGGTQQNMNTTATISANQWHHIRFSRVSGTGYLSINGGTPATATMSNTIRNTAGASIYLGQNAASGMNGYLDEFRFTNGVGRSTASFAAPTTEFPNQ